MLKALGVVALVAAAAVVVAAVVNRDAIRDGIEEYAGR